MKINTTSDALDNLNKKLGGADIEIEPSTNKVDALKKIYKTLGGTDDVSGLSTVYQVIEKITEVAEGGGGNPNRIEVIEGTMYNPFGDVDLEELYDALYRGSGDNGNAHAVIRGDASVLGYGLITQPLYAINDNFRSTAADIGADSCLANNFLWSFVDGVLVDAKMDAYGTITDLSEYASLISTTLTIYWHPMPED